MPMDRLDAEGRITIAQPFRGFLAGRLVQVRTPRGLLLRPIPDRLQEEDLPPASEATGEDAAADETS